MDPFQRSDLRWRPLTGDDAPALAQLEIACASADANTHPLSLAEIEQWFLANPQTEERTLGAFDRQGQLVAAGRVSVDTHFLHEIRAGLDGKVHPMVRQQGIGTALLAWMEARARQAVAALRDPRPLVLRLDFYHTNPQAMDLYRRQGFAFKMTEHHMRRDLTQPLPPKVLLPAGMSFSEWSDELAAAFHTVYAAAFRERPGFPDWSQEVWQQAFTGDETFRPNLTLLLRLGDQPVGYALGSIEDDELHPGETFGFIGQMGIVPAWRRRGLGQWLLSEEMHRMRDLGLAWAGLDVNDNNPNAMRLYQQLGFVIQYSFSSYRKEVTG